MADEASVKDGRAGAVSPSRFDEQHLPWTYGDDRITAMVRGPDSLYVYWEITDPAIAAAKARLGSAGADGWCNLRVYDTTGRAFDGTNANHYFDVGVARTDREYFFDLHRPTASVHIEIGIMSREGYFQAIARSGRADFPRKGPSPNHALEWMTVTTEDRHPAARPYGSRFDAAKSPRRSSSHPPADPRPPTRHAIVGGPVDTRPYTWVHPAFTEVRWEGPWFYEWRSQWKLRWIGTKDGTASLPIENAQWVTGPFPFHLLGPDRLGVRFLGDEDVLLEEHASGLEVFGPWEVRIQGIGNASGERRELATWRVHFARVVPTKVETWWAAVERARVNSWQRTRVVPGGASESVVTVEAGASELWRMGASERWTAGASEWLAQGASGIGWGGASELVYGGASGVAWGGASGVAWGSASGVGWGSASGGALGGASSVAWGGASEAYAEWLAGASGHGKEVR